MIASVTQFVNGLLWKDVVKAWLEIRDALSFC